MSANKHDAPKRGRLDSCLAEKGLSASREKAKSEITAGWVKVDGETVRDPSRRVTGNETITVARPSGLFVSRGGEKLRRALEYFNIDLSGRIAADLGASTGGFTDCMLKHRASLVYACDVGYGQLDYSLRRDPRVVVMERRHVNSLLPEEFPQKPDFIAADLSFISILKVIDRMFDLFLGAEGIILVKPQFESLRSEQKKGVVRKKDDHKAILLRVFNGLISRDVPMLGCVHSPIKGPKGNIEFLLHIRLEHASSKLDEDRLVMWVNEIVDRAHDDLNDTVFEETVPLD